MLGRLIMIGAALTAAPAFANDSVAERGAGGLILSRTDAVSMLSENLSISATRVDVDYVFRNETDADVETIVAFPMPDISASPNEMTNLPDDQSDNFLGFQVSFDGNAVKPSSSRRRSRRHRRHRPAHEEQCARQPVPPDGARRRWKVCLKRLPRTGSRAD